MGVTMNREIRHGKWMQLSGRTKRAFGRLFGADDLAARGDAEIVAGALEESLGLAKQKAVDGISVGVDKLAASTKRLARSL